MIVLRNFSSILNTNAPELGFTRGRKYDMDMNRFGKLGTAQREMQGINQLGRELRNMSIERASRDRKVWQD